MLFCWGIMRSASWLVDNASMVWGIARTHHTPYMTCIGPRLAGRDLTSQWGLG